MSRELDIKVAGLLGWRGIITRYEAYGPCGYPPGGLRSREAIPHYSTDLQAAREMLPDGVRVTLWRAMHDGATWAKVGDSARYAARVPGHSDASAATAICEAWVKWEYA